MIFLSVCIIFWNKLVKGCPQGTTKNIVLRSLPLCFLHDSLFFLSFHVAFLCSFHVSEVLCISSLVSLYWISITQKRTQYYFYGICVHKYICIVCTIWLLLNIRPPVVPFLLFYFAIPFFPFFSAFLHYTEKKQRCFSFLSVSIFSSSYFYIKCSGFLYGYFFSCLLTHCSTKYMYI